MNVKKYYKLDYSISVSLCYYTYDGIHCPTNNTHSNNHILTQYYTVSQDNWVAVGHKAAIFERKKNLSAYKHTTLFLIFTDKVADTHIYTHTHPLGVYYAECIRYI